MAASGLNGGIRVYIGGLEIRAWLGVGVDGFLRTLLSACSHSEVSSGRGCGVA